MHEYISLIRGINVGGKTLKMDKLVSVYESLGLQDILTYIQSGNVLFNTRIKDGKKLRSMIEQAIQKKTGMEVTVLIRTRNEWKKILNKNPFLSRKIELDRLYVTFLEEISKKESVQKISPGIPTSDEFQVAGTEVYLYCPGGYGKTGLSNAFFEKSLKIRATTRNWNTVNKLYEMAF